MIKKLKKYDIVYCINNNLMDFWNIKNDLGYVLKQHGSMYHVYFFDIDDDIFVNLKDIIIIN